MNEEITLYELLGLIKEDKAPYRVKYNDSIYATSTLSGFYEEGNPGNYLLSTIFSNDNDYDALNVKVEIMEEDKKIEKLSKYNWQENGVTIEEMVSIDEIFDKVNELIDVINELIKEVKHD